MEIMMKFEIEGKQAALYPAEDKTRPLILLNEESDGKEVFQTLCGMNCPDFSLLSVSGIDWNHDLSPWQCPPVFNRDAPFSGGADEYLNLLTRSIIPGAVEKGGLRPSFYGIAGYSLAGLFAIYSLYKTDLFSRAACMSGSLWFPDFVEYAESHEPLQKLEKLYFSVGDREERTRNELMKSVRVNMEKLAVWYSSKDIDVLSELNPGNHFKDPPLRIAKGILALLG